MLSPRVAQAANPYDLALQSCLETLYDFLIEKGQEDKRTHVVVECRGKKEDNALELEFRRTCVGANRFGKNFPFSIVPADKKTNSTGLQFADLVARPIGRHLLDRDQENRAFEILRAAGMSMCGFGGVFNIRLSTSSVLGACRQTASSQLHTRTPVGDIGWVHALPVAGSASASTRAGAATHAEIVQKHVGADDHGPLRKWECLPSYQRGCCRIVEKGDPGLGPGE